MRNSLRKFCWDTLLRIAARIDEPWYRWIVSLQNFLILRRTPEIVERRGDEDPTKTYYLIDHFPYYVGLASWYDSVLGHMEHAQAKGWIPVAAETSDPADSGPDGRGSWYTYFKPLSALAPNQIDSRARVIRAPSLQVIYKRYNPREIARRHALAQIAAFNDETRLFVERRFQQLFGEHGAKGYVGVYFRGTDYRTIGSYCPVGHAAVLPYDQFFDRLDRALASWGLNAPDERRIFFVSEEQAAVDALKKRYPTAKCYEKPRFVEFTTKKGIPFQTPQGTTARQNNLMYLLDLYTLSKCDYLVGPRNGGIRMALNLNGNRYKGVDILNTGVN